MNLAKIKTYIGFAKRKGKISFGQTVLYDIKDKRTKLVIIDEAASDNTKDKYISACEYAGIKYLLFPKEEAANAIGKPNVRVICIKDRNLADAIAENLD